jgi:hypothetical protein
VMVPDTVLPPMVRLPPLCTMRPPSSNTPVSESVPNCCTVKPPLPQLGSAWLAPLMRTTYTAAPKQPQHLSRTIFGTGQVVSIH